MKGAVIQQVETIRDRDLLNPAQLPLMRLKIKEDDTVIDMECDCLLIAAGRSANVENLGLDQAGISYQKGAGVKINDLAQCEGNDNVYAVGDCVAGVPRLTHVSGEMAKLVVQNSLFGDAWKVSQLVVPACMYTEPEYATVGLYSEQMAEKHGVQVDVWTTSLEHNDRAILESNNVGIAKVFCRAGTDEIVGAVVVADRAGEIINEVTLAIKNKVSLYQLGRNIHCYPTTGESVMMCGIQFINSKLPRMT